MSKNGNERKHNSATAKSGQNRVGIKTTGTFEKQHGDKWTSHAVVSDSGFPADIGGPEALLLPVTDIPTPEQPRDHAFICRRLL